MADLRIDWTQSPDDPTLSGNVVSYQLARSTGPNPTAIVATIEATADPDDTAYTETLAPGTYFYRVRAVDSAGRHSLWSNEATVTITAKTTLHHRFIAAVVARPRSAAVTGLPRLASIAARPRTVQAGPTSPGGR